MSTKAGAASCSGNEKNQRKEKENCSFIVNSFIVNSSQVVGTRIAHARIPTLEIIHAKISNRRRAQLHTAEKSEHLSPMPAPQF